MNEEKKTYAPGTVTISSEEYRDILTEAFDAKKDMDKWYTKYWEEYHKERSLEEENAKLREELAKLQEELAATKKKSVTISPDEIVAMMKATVTTER